jgi:hypothetical protein
MPRGTFAAHRGGWIQIPMSDVKNEPKKQTLSLKKKYLRTLSDENLGLLDNVVGGLCVVTCNTTRLSDDDTRDES